MDLDAAEDQMWWRLKAGRGGVLEDDWLEQKIVTTEWGDAAGDYREQSPEEFRNGDPSDLQASKFVGYHDDGMSAGDVVVAYAPEKGHISGIGTAGEIQYQLLQIRFLYSVCGVNICRTIHRPSRVDSRVYSARSLLFLT